MTDCQIDRETAERNLVLNQAVITLEEIINHHNPDVDLPIADGVWIALDRMAANLEAKAKREARVEGMRAALAAAEKEERIWEAARAIRALIAAEERGEGKP